MFDFKKFLKEGGVEKYLLEAQFGNDIESRYQYIRPLMSRLPDSARTEAMLDGMEEARAEDDKMAFDFYFVETMKMLGLETELMEADLFDNLAENDNVLDEFLQMPAQEEEEEGEDEVEITINMAESKYNIGDEVIFKGNFRQTDKDTLKVIDMRRMFGSNLMAYTVEFPDGRTAEYDETQLSLKPQGLAPEEKANVFVRELEGEVQTENKLLKASNTLEDALNKVVDDLTDEQIDRFTDMILDLRDKVKSGLNEEEGAADVKTIDKLLPKINNKAEYLEILPKVIGLDIPGVTPQTKKSMLLKLAKQLK